MQIEVRSASLLADYSDQGLTLGEKELITDKHINNILQNSSFISKNQIINELQNLKDLRDRY